MYGYDLKRCLSLFKNRENMGVLCVIVAQSYRTLVALCNSLFLIQRGIAGLCEDARFGAFLWRICYLFVTMASK